MLEITDTQGRILEAFMKYDAQKEGNVGYGLTSGGLEKMGINRKSFDNTDKNSINNRQHLLKNDLITPTRIEKHGKQNWQYYKLTILGVLAYLKWANHVGLKKIISSSFFPLILMHAKEVRKLYGQITDGILAITADRLELELQETLVNSDTGQEKKFGDMIEATTLPIFFVDVTFFRIFKRLKIQRIDHGITTTFENPNLETYNKIADKFTFVFYFNFLNLVFHKYELFNLINKMYPVKLENGKLDSKYTKTLVNKIKKNAHRLTMIISSDPQLSKIFKENLSEISKGIPNKELTEFILSKLK